VLSPLRSLADVLVAAVIGLDTSLNDANPAVTAHGTSDTFLPEEQLAWAKARIDAAVASGRGVILMCHHMLFSLAEAMGSPPSYTNERLYAQFGPEYIAKIALWFWGHEHSWMRYGPYRGLRHAFLQGNAGIPVFPKDKGYATKPLPGQVAPQALSKPPQTFKVDGVELYCNGLYALEFNGPELAVQYWELHQKGADWALEPVQGERILFRNNGGHVE
jgi:hypothetical protein